MSTLVIVESPAKARTIGGYLGKGFVVESSIGHIRDLPQSAAETPAKIKDKPWGRLAVDVDHGFEPYYVVPRDKKSHIAKLKTLLKDADELYLATDEDREGEAISWHLLEYLKPKVPVKRMVFHEITKSAIDHAVNYPRGIDYGLVDAAETRRVLDRLYGYEVSPVLWRRVNRGLSAGRVQSPSIRLIVERERERIAFVSAGYWDIDLLTATSPSFTATLVALDGTKVAAGKDFDSDGRPRKSVVVVDEARARALVDALAGADVAVRSVEEKPYRSSPKAPFMTSTLQQEGGRSLLVVPDAQGGVPLRIDACDELTFFVAGAEAVSGPLHELVSSQCVEVLAVAPGAPPRANSRRTSARSHRCAGSRSAVACQTICTSYCGASPGSARSRTGQREAIARA